MAVPYSDYDAKNQIPLLVGSGVYRAKYGTTFKVTVSPYGENNKRDKQSVEGATQTYFVSPNSVSKAK